MRTDLKDSRGFTIGYSIESDREIQYWGMTKGYIGKFTKSPPRWWKSNGTLGPMGDIGYSEVLRLEGAK